MTGILENDTDSCELYHWHRSSRWGYEPAGPPTLAGRIEPHSELNLEIVHAAVRDCQAINGQKGPRFLPIGAGRSSFGSSP